MRRTVCGGQWRVGEGCAGAWKVVRLGGPWRVEECPRKMCATCARRNRHPTDVVRRGPRTPGQKNNGNMGFLGLDKGRSMIRGGGGGWGKGPEDGK